MKYSHKSTDEENLRKISDYDKFANGCWIGRDTRPDGYCRVSIDGKMTYVHRLSWSIFFGPIPEGMWVLHKCDNRACRNPDHLFLGTRQDNVDDMMDKGRHKAGIGNRRLTKEKYTAIMGMSRKGIRRIDIGKCVGFSQSQINKIVNGKVKYLSEICQ